MSTPKPATPLPWFSDDEIIMPSFESAPFDDAAYDKSAQAWVADCRNGGNGKANAAYIVAACNNMPRLIALLQAAVDDDANWLKDATALLIELGERQS